MPFQIQSPYQPAGDQPKAIAELTAGLQRGDRFQTLLGVTGSGKTMTVANVIQNIGLPTLVLGSVFWRWFSLKEKKLELEASLAAERAAQYAASNAELEARVRVLEKIVTDGGVQTAAQIEALRDKPLLENGDKVQ